MRSVVSLFCLAAAVIVSGACAMHVVVPPAMPPADSVTRPSLTEYMRSATSPTIVLRVPSPQSQVAQAQGQQGDPARNQIYNLIEKELVKANFAVRDRALLDAIVRSGQNLDYPLILKRTNAELILEIMSIESKDFSNDRYSRADKKGDGVLRKGKFPLQGWEYECKLTLVRTGEIGGIYTISVAPVENHFVVKGNKFQNASASGAPDPAHTGYGLTLPSTAQAFVQRLLAEVRSR